MKTRYFCAQQKKEFGRPGALLQYSGFFVIAIDVSADFSVGCDYDNIDEFGSLRIAIDFTKPLDYYVVLRRRRSGNFAN